MIPALLGNIIGGSLFCGVYFWWMYLVTESTMGADEASPGILGRAKAVTSDEESKIDLPSTAQQASS